MTKKSKVLSESATDAGKTETPENEPNVVFVGRRKVLGDGGKFETADKEMPKFISVPLGKIILPEIAHGQPFYHEKADVLIANSKDFKAFVSKGEKS